MLQISWRIERNGCRRLCGSERAPGLGNRLPMFSKFVSVLFFRFWMADTGKTCR